MTLSELDSIEGTDHMSALAHLALNTSAKVLTEIIEEKFLPTLQDHISICFQCALANQQIDIRKEANQPARPVHLLQLDDILSQLQAHANELDTTAQTIRKLDTAKLEAATELRSHNRFWRARVTKISALKAETTKNRRHSDSRL